MTSLSPTLVLVHGAFTDGSGWAPVTRVLLEQGHPVLVPPVQNRSLVADAAHVRSIVEQVDGPVVLAGHSYGGAVISVAGAAPNVVALVFVAGYVLDEGESLARLQGGFPDSDLPEALVTTPYPVAGAEPGLEVSVRVDAFAEVLADGVDPSVAGVLAVSQRPLAATALTEPAPVAAWKTRPVWGIVAAADRAINPDVERYGYRRAGSRHVIELAAPHLVMHTHPGEVAKVIADAATEAIR